MARAALDRGTARYRTRVSKRTLLYLAGCGRSGSTLLGNVLGQLDGWVHVGELRHLFGEGLRDGIPCGCGTPVPECGFWRAVLERAFGEAGPRVEELITLQRQAMASTQILRAARGVAGRGEAGERFTRVLSRIYAAVCEESGAHVIVDGSKSPFFGVLSQGVPEIAWRPLHLVRDPRAVAYSSVRRWERRGGPSLALMRGTSMMRKRLRSTGRNLLVEKLWKNHPAYTRLRYEDFVANPSAELSAIAANLDEILPEGFISADRSVTIAPCHAVSGNRMRTQVGPLTLELDDEWRGGLRGMDRWITDLCTFPLKRRYGYTRHESL